MKAKITSYKQFCQCVRRTETLNAHTGEWIRPVYNLVYGFIGRGVNIRASNKRAAYRKYREGYKYYDQFIPAYSFLNKSSKA